MIERTKIRRALAAGCAFFSAGLVCACAEETQGFDPDALTEALIHSDPNIAALIEAHPEMTLGWTEEFWADALLNAPAYPASAWRVHDLGRPQPPVVSPQPCPNAPPPEGATVLFDGGSADQFTGKSLDLWSIEDGALVSSGKKNNRISSKAKFGDVRLHLEFKAPAPVVGHGQFRGNSGVFLMERYEVQILDSYENPTYADGQLGAVYGQHPPLANPAAPPGVWQCMDIIFIAPVFDGAELASPAKVTVTINGVLVQDESVIKGTTRFAALSRYKAHEDALPVALQDHGDAGGRVAFRNVWALPLPAPAQD